MPRSTNLCVTSSNVRRSPTIKTFYRKSQTEQPTHRGDRMWRVPGGSCEVRERRNNRHKGELRMLKVGDTAPAFTIQTHEGKDLSLASLRGKKVLLWFYPKA